MIVGSSALNNASNQTIVSPVIEVKLTNTYFYQGISYGGHQGSLRNMTDPNLKRGGDAIFWKGNYYVFENDRLIQKYSYINNGLSLVSGTTIGVSGTWAYSMGKFLSEGETLNLFFHPYRWTSIGLFVQKYSTSNGLSWDGPENIYGGTIIVDFAPVNGDAIYVQTSTNPVYLYSRGVGEIQMVRKNIAGGTWGATCIYDKKVAYPLNNYFGLQALGTTANMPQWGQSSYNLYEDYVYYNYTGTTGGGLSDLFMGMRTFTSNRYDMFNEKNIITNNGPGYLNIIPFGMKKGLSYYYHYFKLIESFYRNTTGYTVQQDVTIGYFYQQSRNGYQWTVPRYVGPANNNDGSVNYLDGVFAAGGATVPEMMIFTGKTAMCLWYETNELDLSANITTYENRDNEDISITLGNYK